MCHDLKTLAKVKSGELAFCETCNIYHLEFNNIYCELSAIHFKKLKTYVQEIDIDYWEQKYAYTNIKRKIPITTACQNIVLMFNRQEVEELKALFYNKSKGQEYYLGVDDIDYMCVLN
ncbi:DUF6686 family protein [Mariniflexile litorale]|uniref:DUF6686 family protein n=1 Tax=Mariniflexile litorale TaxID=3045158 RepID=A0AAU7EJX3_9FLAO|nr:DUF6686 family protein [Mariniflexile sp. KMM 9835]MDQ8213231.1 hypothetical protein [Mariniflexile sp. KMM 9835]